MAPRALRFMAEFRCIGPECEDSCCANWQIDVDRQHFVKISRLLVRTEEGRQELGTAFVGVPEDKKTLGRYMRMQLREDGRCPFWADDKWCTIQRRWGERMLPDVCAHYPRSISVVRDELELSGQLSCPEVARKCLLGENSGDLIEVDEVPFARGAVKQRTYLTCGDPYYERFLEAREALLGILDRREYPMRSRLFFTLVFADRTKAFFHRGTQSWSEEDWAVERSSMADKTVLDDLHHGLDTLEIPDALALFVIARVLAGDVQLRTGGRFRDVVNEVLDSYHQEIGAADASAREMWEIFVKRRAARTAQAGARIDDFFERYCRQFWVRDWYVDSVSLYPHVQALFVRIAVLRFLLLSHPDPDLDTLAVRVFSSMFRGIEHHDSFLKLIGEGMSKDLPTVLDAAALLFV